MINARGLYECDYKTLVNTSEFTRTAQEFKKNNGVYTKAHPVYDEAEYNQFWDIERDRRRNGYSVGGVRITGDHYNFLNFTQIVRTNSDDALGSGVGTTQQSMMVGKQADFPDFWDGHYYMYHAKEDAWNAGLHFLGGKARRKGFSWSNAADACNALELNRRRSVILGAFDSAYITEGDGIMVMAKLHLDFMTEHTAFKHNRLINSADVVKLGYKLKGEDIERGLRSSLLAISFKNNPDAARGKDAVKVFFEELGTFPNLKAVISAVVPAMEDGARKTGQILAWGTGGSKDANWRDFEEIYYNPKPHKFLSCENVWDGIEGDKPKGCGYFFPYWQNLVPYIDESGNSDKAVSLKYIEEDRKTFKEGNSDVAGVKKYIAERAIKPLEAFSRSSTNMFSSPLLDDWIDRVSKDSKYKNFPRYGQLYNSTEGMQLVTNSILENRGLPVHPLVDCYPLIKDMDLHGCFVEWSPPFKRDGLVPENLYRVWVDPYGQDKDSKDIDIRGSLGAIYVYERPNVYTDSKGDVLVGAFVGRPEKMNIFNDIAFNIADYYGGQRGMIMFENDRGTLKERAQQKGHRYYDLLADEPDLSFKKEVKYSKTGRAKGISMGSGKRIPTAAVYFKDWLYTERGLDEYGNMRYNLHYIFDLGLLLEIQKFSIIGNFDRLSALFAGMYDKEEQYDKMITVREVTEDPNSYFNRRKYQ